jgi:hypothetical protein
LRRSSRRCSNSPPCPHLPTPPPATAGCFAVNDRQTEEKKMIGIPRPNHPNSSSQLLEFHIPFQFEISILCIFSEMH